MIAPGSFVINSIFGGMLIFLINLIGSSFDFHIGLNLFTAVFVGVLGVPGAIMLVLIQLFIV